MKEKVFNFFEKPSTPLAKAVQWLIGFAIIYSVAVVFFEYLRPELAEKYKDFLYKSELIVVTIFSAEYLIKLWSAPNRLKFITNFYSIIDLLAIVPFFFGVNSSALRIARALRLLRLAKFIKHFWKVDDVNLSRIVQENIFKNLVIVSFLLWAYQDTEKFIKSVPSDVLGDLVFAASILALAAMFGFFALSYANYNPKRTSHRLLIHITSASLLVPIGVMFMIIQISTNIIIGLDSPIIFLSVWFTYIGVILFDFANVFTLDNKVDS